ncbi:hypothetical protein NE237_020450 [Protea cynaroides]|uniref:Uncharacterized protein n=1 Tax=Protea cynaroides TaxID=273540 RepID=A0A9Q0H795_9MAGN|nr:hypothetical protein NE237_020450 [Protea cynaroides]
MTIRDPISRIHHGPLRDRVILGASFLFYIVRCPGLVPKGLSGIWSLHETVTEVSTVPRSLVLNPTESLHVTIFAAMDNRVITAGKQRIRIQECEGERRKG